MSDKNELSITFGIQRIETLQFAILQEAFVREKLAYGVNFGYGIDAEAPLVQCMFRYELQSDSVAVLLIEVAVEFSIEPGCFNKHFKPANQLIIPKGFATHIALITVGTARGILHEKTKGTAFNSLPIPSINVASQIKADISFEAA